MVGTRSVAWANWWRSSPLALMPLGQEMSSGSATPPSKERTLGAPSGATGCRYGVQSVGHRVPHVDVDDALERSAHGPTSLLAGRLPSDTSARPGASPRRGESGG